MRISPLLLGCAALLLGGCTDVPEPDPAAEAEITESAAQPRTDQAILTDFQSEDPAVREAAARDVAERGVAEPGLISALITQLADNDAKVVAAVQDALYALGPQAVPALTEALAHPAQPVRTGALVVLARNGKLAAEAVDEMTRVLREYPQWSVRFRAAEALGAMGATAEPAIPALEAALQDDDPNVRTAAESALKRIRAQTEAAGGAD